MPVLRRPIHWNPVRVRIETLTRTGPTIDPVFKTPINQKVRAESFVYAAQVNFRRKDQEQKLRTETGDRAQTRAHLVFRTIDLMPHTVLPKPQKGWKIVALYVGEPDEIAVDYVIEEMRLEAPLRGRPLLLYAEYALDRDRAKTT